MIRSLRAIAFQSLHHAVRTRVFLLVAAGTLLVVLAGLEDVGLIAAGGAEEASQREARIRTSGAEDFLSLWVEAAALAGLFLGATAVTSDLRSRTLESVLVRPVPRPVYLLGRWIGVQALVLLFSGAGVTLGVFLLGLPRLEPGPLLWLGVAQLFISAVLLTTLGMAFGARWHAVTAGSLAVLLVLLPTLLLPFLDHPAWPLRWFARAVYFLGPAAPQDGLITAALTQTQLSPSYGEPLLIALENALYTVAALGLGVVLFQRREIRSPD